MGRNPAPIVIDSSRVLAYAFVDDIPYRKAGSLFVDDKLLQQVPRLAICTNLGEDIGPMLFHCNEEWTVLGVSGKGTVEDIKVGAESNYPGVGARWVELSTTVEEALQFYDAQAGNFKCSFCGKRPFEVEGWIEGASAIICKGCIESYYRDFQAGSDSESAS